MGLLLENIRHTVKNDVYLDDVSLEFKPGSRHVILGRTLAGKTSLLRAIAGLDRPVRGRIIAKGSDVTGRSVKKRNIAMVYQQFINYPSFTVFDNIASPLKTGGAGKETIRDRVCEVAKLLRIDHLLDRLPAELSGGQQQRTAIARALVKEADLLLLDEPLVNLDYKLREELREELKEIFDRRDSIVIYTTTEPSEALMLGGHIVVMDEGRVHQTGETSGVYQKPATMKVAQIFSDPPVNILEARFDRGQITFGDVTFTPPGRLASVSPGDYLIGIRASHLSLTCRNENDILFPAETVLTEMSGSETFIHVKLGEHHLVVQEDGIHDHAIGVKTDLFANPGTFLVFDAHGELVSAP